MSSVRQFAAVLLLVGATVAAVPAAAATGREPPDSRSDRAQPGGPRGGPHAPADDDTTPPELDLPTHGSFIVDTVIGPMGPTSLLGATFDIPIRAVWTAHDPSGVCGFSTRRVFAGFDPGPWSEWTDDSFIVDDVTDYDSQFGGGSSKFHGFQVRARDCAGNVTPEQSQLSYISFRPGVFQESEDSYSVLYGTAQVDYTGAWQTATCECSSGGATQSTTERHAVAEVSLDVFAASQPVALVMPTGPEYGKAFIRVDGKPAGIVDTHADTAEHRSVVWTDTLSQGAHTITIKNMATPRRSRIDLDAVLINGVSG